MYYLIFEDGQVENFKRKKEAEKEAEYYGQIKSIVVDEKTADIIRKAVKSGKLSNKATSKNKT